MTELEKRSEKLDEIRKKAEKKGEEKIYKLKYYKGNNYLGANLKNFKIKAQNREQVWLLARQYILENAKDYKGDFIDINEDYDIEAEVDEIINNFFENDTLWAKEKNKS